MAPPEAVGVGMFMEMCVSYLLLGNTDDDIGVVKAWLLGTDSASASAVIDSFMVNELAIVITTYGLSAAPGRYYESQHTITVRHCLIFATLHFRSDEARQKAW